MFDLCLFSNDNGVLDDGHLYLSADEVLFEEDEAVEVPIFNSSDGSIS